MKRFTVSARSNATLWLLLGVLGAAAVTYLYTGPKIAELKDVRVTALAKAADTEALQDRVTQIVALDQQLALREASLRDLDVAVPVQAGVDEFIRSLEAMASSSGVLITGIQPVQAEGASAATVSATLRGSYSGIHLFLQHVAGSRRPVLVRNLALTATADADGTSLLSATLQLEAATAQVDASGAKQGDRGE